jgi:hypothetical protein
MPLIHALCILHTRLYPNPERIGVHKIEQLGVYKKLTLLVGIRRTYSAFVISCQLVGW